MADDIAYVPTQETLENPYQEPKSAVVPPYDDVGVSYKGYSKTLISEGNYKLNLQTPFSFNFYTGSIAPSSIENHYFSDFPPEGKIMYISGLQLDLSVSAVAAGNYFRILNGNSSTDILYNSQILRSGNQKMIFNPPLKVTKWSIPGSSSGGVHFKIYSGAATINECNWNVQGWWE